MANCTGKRAGPLAVLIVVAILVALPPLAESGESAAYRRSVDEWHAGRIERLEREDGWLSLVGLFPLSEGINRFGSHADNDLVFPDKAPQQAGIFLVENGTVKLAAEPGVTIFHDGEPVMAMELRNDTQENTTVLDMGSFRFYVLERDGAQYVRLKDRKAKALKRFRGIERFPVGEGWRITARFEAYRPPRTIHVPNVLGHETTAQCPGALVFDVDGRECRLEPMSADDESMFIVFGDETSGLETYAGGRFIYVSVPDSAGTVVIDFNRSYNPPCVFTPYATCPLPHPANVLPVAITAGEKNFADAK